MPLIVQDEGYMKWRPLPIGTTEAEIPEFHNVLPPSVLAVIDEEIIGEPTKDAARLISESPFYIFIFPDLGIDLIGILPPFEYIHPGEIVERPLPLCHPIPSGYWAEHRGVGGNPYYPDSLLI